ncbi:MAG: hypothetical protein HKN32_04655, partial [Flavobacteriales bacterium]|nr:hypothetical protein [Flavobacteriales bacterium]
MKTTLSILCATLMASSLLAQSVWKNEYPTMTVPTYLDAGVTSLEYARSVTARGSIVAQLDINGEIEWQGKFLGSMEVGTLIGMDDGTTLAAGVMTINTPEPHDEIVLSLLDNEGVLIWTKNFALDGFSCGARCLAIDADGSIVLGGWRSTEVDGQGTIDGLVARFSQAGEFLNAQVLEENTSVADLTIDASGSILACGSRNETSVGNYSSGYFSIFSLDANFETQWWLDRNFSFIEGSAIGVEEDSAGNFWVAGTVASEDLAFLKVNLAGDILQEIRLNGAIPFEAVALDIDAEGKLIVAGNVLMTSLQSTDYWRPMQVILDPLGEVEIFRIYDDPAQNPMESGGLSILADQTTIWTCFSQGDAEIFKMQGSTAFPQCTFIQPNLTVTFSDMQGPEVNEYTFSSLTLAEGLGPNFATTSYASEVVCSENLCDASATVAVNDLLQCAGSTFSFNTLETFDIYEWYVDG